jgi:hypothetical protein
VLLRTSPRAQQEDEADQKPCEFCTVCKISHAHSHKTKDCRYRQRAEVWQAQQQPQEEEEETAKKRARVESEESEYHQTTNNQVNAMVISDSGVTPDTYVLSMVSNVHVFNNKDFLLLSNRKEPIKSSFFPPIMATLCWHRVFGHGFYSPTTKFNVVSFSRLRADYIPVVHDPLRFEFSRRSESSLPYERLESIEKYGIQVVDMRNLQQKFDWM